MKKSPSWEANRSQISREIPRILPPLQVPTTCPYPEPDQSSPWTPHPTSSRYILILPSHLRRGLPIGFFPSGLPTKSLHAPLLFARCAACPPISFLILSLAQYVVRNMDKAACRSTTVQRERIVAFLVTWRHYNVTFYVNFLSCLWFETVDDGHISMSN